MPLYLDYRPDTLNDFIGNDAAKSVLSTVLARQQDKRRTYLITGPTGCGKTTLARIIGNIANCHPDDFYEYNASNTRGIDTIRQIQENTNYLPKSGDCSIYLLDECHKLTNEAQNALLKLCEEPPKHVYIILSTTNEEKLISTLKSGRLAEIRVTKLLNRQIRELIDSILVKEKIEDFPPNVIREIVNAAEGIPRQALSILDSVIDMTDEEEMIRAVYTVGIGEGSILELCIHLMEKVTKDNQAKWIKCVELLKNIEDSDVEDVRYSVLGFLRKELFRSGDPLVAQMMDFFFEPFYNKGKAGLAHACWCACMLKF